MSRIIFIHSFRGGTGKTNITANLATLLAAEGRRVGVVDTNFESPGLHFLFGMEDPEPSLNDYLLGKCDIEKAVYDMTGTRNQKGKLFLIPSSTQLNEMAKVWNEGIDVDAVTDVLQELPQLLDLEFLLIDTNPGLCKETLFTFAISNGLLFISCPDAQDYQGTAVAVHVTRKLEIPNIMLLVNKVPPALQLAEVKQRVEQISNYKVCAVLPHSDDMLNLASSGIFVLRYPDHPITEQLTKVAHQLMLG